MNVIDTLFLALGVDAKGIDKGLNEARAKIQAGAQGLANSLMAPFKTALGAVAAGLSLGAVTNQYLQQADAIGKMADSIGVDMEELQAWGEAAADAGGSAQAFQQTVSGLTTRIQEAAKGQGEAAAMFQSFGIKVTDATGKARDSFDVLRDLAGAMEGMDKQRAMGLGQKLGIDRGTIMLLQSGKVAVEDLVREYKELGLYTKEDAELSAKANHEIQRLGVALKGNAAIIMRAIVPAITMVTKLLISLSKDFRKHKTFYLAALGGIAAFLTAKMIPTLVKVGLLNARIWAPYAVVAGIIAGLALIFDDLWTYMNGGKSALEDYWKTLGTGPELLEKFNKAWQAVKEKGGAVLEGLKSIAKSVFGFFERNIDNFLLMFDGIWEAIDGLFNFDFEKLGRGLGKAFNGAWRIIKGLFKDIFGWFDDIAGSSESAWDAVAKIAKQAWDSISEFAMGFFNQLDPELQRVIKNAAALAGAWAITKTVNGIAGIGKEVAGLGTIIKGVFNVVKAHPFGMLLAAIGLIIANWDLISKKITEFFKWLDEKWKGFKKAFTDFGINLEKAEQERNEQVTNADNYGAGIYGSADDVIKAATAARAAPTDAMPAQAVAQTNMQETNVTNNDNRNITLNMDAALSDLAQFQRDANKIFKDPPNYFGRMAASGQTN